ncbi:MOSC domain-containing protein [Nocardioides KLBMP 9356]|uniref:MOSC domain-containing protein n=1 Tax=Nocardioides potassii TaxID=2911371 RepID=A0ABS9H8E2_9ACTN|nr:MOSC N-terminal beta barrel domain-containing protein [Nocardioides potassii]MCF6376460.1 MOSC domain-containing protein [Nocardioides potassii]
MEAVVRGVGFSPVKGMRHLALDHVYLDRLGAVGDRAFCVVDPAARRVLRTVQHPSLMTITAQPYDDQLALTLPSGERAEGPATASGETITCDYWGRQVALSLTAGPHAELISRRLGHDERLARAPRGGVVFGDPVTIVTTASLEAMGADAARFRATLLVETDEPWVEESWLGREVEVGDATLRIGGPVPRCAVIDHHPETGEKDSRLLKDLVRARPTNKAGEPMFGVYATVDRPGRVAVTR